MKIKRFSFFAVVLFIFIVVNILFNFNSWLEVFSSNQNDKVSIGDSTLAEFILENNYQNIIHLRNPFIIKEKLFYPYTINLSLNDPGASNVIFFLILRPFLNVHQAMLFIVLLNSFFANLFMYILLRRLRMNENASLIVALSYGFMPLVPYRLLGHYTYTSIYLFPVAFILFHSYLKQKTNRRKCVFALAIGIFMAFLLLHNFYFFITLILVAFLYILYYFIKSRSFLLTIFFSNVKFLFVSLIVCISILFPWLHAVYTFKQFENMEKIFGFGGATILSADLLGFFTPSEYNPFYYYIFTQLGNFSPLFAKYTRFYLYNWERFVYPGVLILGAYFFLFFFRKKLPRQLIKKIESHFFISIFLSLITLGPFLKVFNKWSLNIDGIVLVFPLPFLILHFIPVLSGVRAPTRFSPAFIFLACLVTGYLLHYFFHVCSKKKYLLLLILLFIFFIDQYYILPPRERTPFPSKIYEYLRKDPQKSTVFEIPFVVRDGFQYIGFVHAIGPMAAQLIHGKPIIGGYFARIPSDIFTYYKNLSFIGYVAKIIDKGNYSPVKEKPQEPVIAPFSGKLTMVAKELDFLNIGYVLLKNDERYTATIHDMLSKLRFSYVFTDENYDLYKRPTRSFYTDTIKFGREDDMLYTAQGFSIRETDFRWIEKTHAQVFIKTKSLKKSILMIEAQSFYKPQKVSFYFDYSLISEIKIGIERKKYYIPIQKEIMASNHGVQIKLSHLIKPSAVLRDNKDSRSLGIQLFSLAVN